MKKLNQRNSCLVTSVTCLRRKFWCLLKNKIEQERSWKRFLLQLKNHYWMKKWSQTFYAFFKMASYEGCFWSFRWLFTLFFIDFITILVYYCVNNLFLNFNVFFNSNDGGVAFQKAYGNFYFLKSSHIYYPDIIHDKSIYCLNVCLQS